MITVESYGMNGVVAVANGCIRRCPEIVHEIGAVMIVGEMPVAAVVVVVGFSATHSVD